MFQLGADGRVVVLALFGQTAQALFHGGSWSRLGGGAHPERGGLVLAECGDGPAEIGVPEVRPGVAVRR